MGTCIKNYQMSPHKDQFTVNVTLLATETEIVHNQ